MIMTSAPISSFVSRRSSFQARPAFSLVEVLLAMFILGIGMIMVASVFPVGANWTRQMTEESVGQTIAQNAKTVLETHYGRNGDLHLFLNPDYMAGGVPNPNNLNTILQQNSGGKTPFTVQALPGFITYTFPGPVTSPGIPPSERAYQFGSNQPFPAKDWQNCTYFWTALARLNPVHRNPTGAPGDATNGIIPTVNYSYDVYILVFRKGAVEHTFANNTSEVPGTRDGAWGPATLVPSTFYATWSQGNYNASRSPSIFNAVPAMGQYGIGANSGTVFKQVVDTTTYQRAIPRPLILNSAPYPNFSANEPVIYAPAADTNDPSASPLIYVYQTTMSFER